MLCFFNVDKTTSILDTNKIVEFKNAEKLEEGITVLVKFGEDEFEANVLKLHGKLITNISHHGPQTIIYFEHF